MLSMTGFGSGEAAVDGFTVTVELRSVNHRFLDVAMKLPSSLSSLEVEVRNRLKDELSRGRVTCQAQVVQAPGAATPRLDTERLDAAIRSLQAVSERLAELTGESHPLRLSDLLSVPELFQGGQPEPSAKELGKGLMTALDGALAGLKNMKQQEGARLVTEMSGRLSRLRGQLDEVRQLAPQAATEAHTRLQERLQALLADEIDPQRLAQEVAILADRANINEECERLGIHLDHFDEALGGGGQVAKQLNFLLQEMHREVNTMGSKTNLMEITRLVIAMKEEVESLREQVQNLE